MGFWRLRRFCGLVCASVDGRSHGDWRGIGSGFVGIAGGLATRFRDWAFLVLLFPRASGALRGIELREVNAFIILKKEKE